MKKQMDKEHSSSGFTLAELLIVVAIIGILVAISIPIFTAQLHKARVATDWANLRAYFSEIQADYNATGEFNPEIAKYTVDTSPNNYALKEIDFLNGEKVKLKAGSFMMREVDLDKYPSSGGYQIIYQCDKAADPEHYSKCSLTLGVRN